MTVFQRMRASERAALNLCVQYVRVMIRSGGGRGYGRGEGARLRSALHLCFLVADLTVAAQQAGRHLLIIAWLAARASWAMRGRGVSACAHAQCESGVSPRPCLRPTHPLSPFPPFADPLLVVQRAVQAGRGASHRAASGGGARSHPCIPLF